MTWLGEMHSCAKEGWQQLEIRLGLIASAKGCRGSYVGGSKFIEHGMGRGQPRRSMRFPVKVPYEVRRVEDYGG